MLKKTFSASIVKQRKWKRKRYPFTASSFRFRFHKNLPLPPLPLPASASASTSLIKSQHFQDYIPNGRGGVEDTRLEAKAKDTKKSEAKAKDSLSEDRHSRGQGQECSRPRPRTQAHVLSKKKKGLHKNFSGDLQKKKVLHKKKRSSKKSPKKEKRSSQKQKKIFEDLRPRGQGLQNLSSRTPPLPSGTAILQPNTNAI